MSQSLLKLGCCWEREMQKGIETETRGHVTAAQMGGLHSVVSQIRCEFTRSQDSEIIGIVSC